MRSKSLHQVVLPVLLLACLAGCRSNKSCFEGESYQAAVDRPRLQVPAQVAGGEKAAPLTIPAAAPDATKLDPKPKCIDEPPSFFGPGKAAAAPAHDAN